MELACPYAHLHDWHDKCIRDRFKCNSCSVCLHLSSILKLQVDLTLDGVVRNAGGEAFLIELDDYCFDVKVIVGNDGKPPEIDLKCCYQLSCIH